MSPFAALMVGCAVQAAVGAAWYTAQALHDRRHRRHALGGR